MTKYIINTREDLDELIGTPEYDNFIISLKGSMIRKQDIQIYPKNYNQSDYEGEKLNPVWQDIEDLSIIERFGFNKNDLLLNNKTEGNTPLPADE